MIDFTQDDDGLLVVRIEGVVDQSQYQAMMPRIEAVIANAPGKLSAILDIAQDADIEPSVLWDDMKFGEANAQHVSRLAVVGPPKWSDYVELLRDARMESALFPVGDLQAAREWAKAAG